LSLGHRSEVVAEVGAGDSHFHDLLVVVDNFVAAKLKRKSNICSIFKKRSIKKNRNIYLLFL
jgi:hypothetical protein